MFTLIFRYAIICSSAGDTATNQGNRDMTELDKQIAHAADQYNSELMWCREEDAAAWLRVMYELIELRNNQAA